jgi:putative phosphoesterase
MLIGILSDTHGILRESATDALQGVDTIVHAGDIGGPEIISALEKIAPVKAVRGNTDNGGWAKTLPWTDMLSFNGSVFYVVHDLYGIDLDPEAAGVQVVVSGHTHKPMIKYSANTLYFNPGSASQRRHGGPLSVGRILISDKGLQPEIITLD